MQNYLDHGAEVLHNLMRKVNQSKIALMLILMVQIMMQNSYLKKLVITQRVVKQELLLDQLNLKSLKKIFKQGKKTSNYNALFSKNIKSFFVTLLNLMDVKLHGQHSQYLSIKKLILLVKNFKYILKKEKSKQELSLQEIF